jgi:quercetin dioxygenase-like cupin family protein
VRRFVLVAVLVATTAWLAAGTALGAITSGSLPAAGLTYVGQTVNDVNMQGDVKLRTKGTTNVKTTYSIVAPSTAIVGPWHYHNGPVIVTVTVGTLTFYDASCGSWDVTAGQVYVESTGQVLTAKALPDRNSGASVEWFTTRLYPAGTTDPVVVTQPCTP